ncbi:sulfotransferase 6B1-like [Petromyzon marinus]|uniref:sulfotransferase 6B1-like n=1 Tax=Petromyzon marinus TaxID=7757 RepID=UPI003F722D18
MAAQHLEVKTSAVIEAFNNVLEESEKLPEDKKLSVVDGIKYPRLLQADTLKLLPGFAARPDDILLVTYPKSGCNWVSRLLQSMLYLAHPALEEAMKENIHLPLLEFGPPGKMKDLDAAPSPRLFVTHLSDLIPKGFFECGCKVVLVFREPKDTAVSFYHFYNNNPGLPSVGSWDEFFRMFMEGDVAWGSYFDHVKYWSKRWEDKNILTSTYEELKADLPGELQKMSTFLGLGLSGEQISDVADNGTFSAMKAKAEADNLKFGKVVFRKGEVGDWNNHFSEEQRVELEAKYVETLVGTSLATRLNY